MEFYIFKRIVSKLINETFYYLKKLLRKGKTVLKFLVFIFIVLFIFYICKFGGFTYGR